jgi:hypothetical protein
MFLSLCGFSTYEIWFESQPLEAVWSPVLSFFGHLSVVNKLLALVQETFPPPKELQQLTEEFFYDYVHRHSSLSSPQRDSDLTDPVNILMNQAPIEVHVRCYSQIGNFEDTISLLNKIEMKAFGWTSFDARSWAP